MLFNSLTYALFLPIVFFLYWFVFGYALDKCKHQVLIQNAFLVLASYVFYAYWDWRFLGLLVGMSLLSYGVGQVLTNATGGGIRGTSRKILLWAAIVIDLGILGFFKYYNFFVNSFCDLFGLDASHSTLQLILPLGISFFTFQAISYVVDAYKRPLHGYTNSPFSLDTVSPVKRGTPCPQGQGESKPLLESLINCLLYIGFFPKLLAGPIERPSNFIPQCRQKRVFDYALATDGCRQILWGLFKKVVVADNCATYVNAVYADIAHQSGSTLLLAAILYTIQIYGDFSGYSDMAIGSAKLLGFRFKDNFLFPYFSRNMNEFWRRWHISLNTWFVDYVYIPLGGSRNGKARTIANTMIIFLLSGLWHGADWSFVAWGGYHGLLLVILILLGLNTKYENVVAHDRWYPNVKEIGQMLLTFALATIGWILFRADNFAQAWEVMSGICDRSLLSVPWLRNRHWYCMIIISVLIMFIVEWLARYSGRILSFGRCRILILLNYLICFIIAELIYFLGHFDYSSFIYFQF